MESGTKELVETAQASSPEPVRTEPVFGAAAGGTFYRARYRFYMAVLIFVVAVGLPIISVPALRHRLSGRIQTLREAMAGGRIKPAIVMVGENHEPFPAEYAKKTAPPNYPKLPAYFSGSQGGLNGPIVSVNPIPNPVQSRGRRTVRIPKTSEGQESQSLAANTSAQSAAGQDTAGAEAQPKYQQGQMEKEAYDFLLSSNPTINNMVHGLNLTLRFKSWDALKREEDAYWVRLTFTNVADNTDVEYIWQVKLLAKQITPLSYNARSISNP